MTSTSTNVEYDETQAALFGMRKEDDRSKLLKAISGVRSFATGYPMGMVGAVIMAVSYTHLTLPTILLV